ncbi:MAG: sigma-54 dependent transcriptional regulator [Tannerella sp.]|jgi:two-component system NtrC family response regulator|nr:sigma-54 dependent transcriptional regulator [Tannerella sp.]
MILIIDDDTAIRSSLAFLLRHAGYEAKVAAGPKEGLDILRGEAVELVLMDMNFSLTTTGEEGLLLLKQVKVLFPALPVILITAWGSISLAVEGMRAGAFDFITKPWSNLMLLKSVRTALDLSKPLCPDASPMRFDRIIGNSPALRKALDIVEHIAPTQASALITGESGTGKELIAEAIHANSPRAAAPFVKVNLGGLTQSLFESEMFGHKRGAFTDATADRKGRFEMADKGSIFLDEIGDLDLACQVKLLRVLQDQTFEPLGDSRPHKVDVRVISATNADLQGMVAGHTFREDLFWRINLVTIHLPPLRERGDDIPLLARHFAREFARKNKLPEADFSADACEFLVRQPFPGNIRELKNWVERSLLLTGKRLIGASDLRQQAVGRPEPAASSSPTAGATLEDMEKRSILAALDKQGGNLSKVAKALGISRAALYRRLEKYDIQLPR